jgi:hypothetical protein
MLHSLWEPCEQLSLAFAWLAKALRQAMLVGRLGLLVARVAATP